MVLAEVSKLYNAINKRKIQKKYAIRSELKSVVIKQPWKTLSGSRKIGMDKRRFERGALHRNGFWTKQKHTMLLQSTA